MTMRIRIGLAVCLLVSIAAPLLAQESDAATVRKLEEKWADSYKHRQIDILSSLLSEDFIITVEDGNTYSKAGYISHSADNSTRVQVSEFTDMKVHMHGNTAIVIGAYHERGESGGKVYDYRDRFTDVWMKVAGKWQVVASQYSTPVKQ
jgi:ketosteroid isomerase-like protein